MKLLLDQGLPRSAVDRLREAGVDAIHVGDIGMASASDDAIIERARAEGWVVVTLDADFHMLIALSGASQPSVVRIRIEGLRADPLSALLVCVLAQCCGDLDAGALVSVQADGIRVHRLPIVR
jgi:predicted nuclease of predicted toxin-antitoxin system